MITQRGEVRRWIDAALEHTGDECLVWPYRVATSGYGEMSRGGRHRLAHRWVCEAAHGMPPTGADAAHSCGNRLCCNPTHLRWATRKENHGDKRGHGTHLYGETAPAARLTESEVKSIRESSEPGADLGRRFGVSPNTIYAVRKERSWRHLIV